MLNNAGKLYSMGDDTYGQCGIEEWGRMSGGPFLKTKVLNPTALSFFENEEISKIWSKGDFNFVLTKSKILYGFGSNSHL